MEIELSMALFPNYVHLSAFVVQDIHTHFFAKMYSLNNLSLSAIYYANCKSRCKRNPSASAMRMNVDN